MLLQKIACDVAGIGNKAGQGNGTNADAGCFIFRIDGAACCDLDRSDGCRAAEREQPCLPIRFEAPNGLRRQNDTFEHKMLIGHQQRSLI